ncbi:MAG: hypothetical protein QXT56_04965, partial [Candidatus Nitrosocaldus sp.]
PLRQQLILEATKHSVGMINRYAWTLLKPLPVHLRFIAYNFLKYVSSKMLEYLKEAEDAIENGHEDRLMLYKDLVAVNDEGEAVMNIAGIINELTSLQRLNEQAGR